MYDNRVGLYAWIIMNHHVLSRIAPKITMSILIAAVSIYSFIESIYGNHVLPMFPHISNTFVIIQPQRESIWLTPFALSITQSISGLVAHVSYRLPLWKMIGNCRLASSGRRSSIYALTGIMNSLFGSFAHASHIFSQNLCLGCLASASLTLERISRLVIAWRVGMQT